MATSDATIQLIIAAQNKANAAFEEAVSGLKSIADQADKTSKSLGDAQDKTGSAVKSVGEALTGAGETAKGFFDEFSSGFVSAAAGAVASGLSIEKVVEKITEAVTEGILKVAEFVEESISVAREAEVAQAHLSAALVQQGTAVPEVIDQYRELGATYQLTTKYSEAQITATESMLAQIGGVAPDAMDKALRATTDLAAGGMDLHTATLLVSKAFEDNFTSLKRYGIEIDTAKAKAEGIDYVLGQIEAKVSGQATADLATYTGQVQQLGNMFEDVQKPLGDFIIKSQGMADVLGVARAGLLLLKGELSSYIVQLQLAAALAPQLGLGFLVPTEKDSKDAEATLGARMTAGMATRSTDETEVLGKLQTAIKDLLPWQIQQIQAGEEAKQKETDIAAAAGITVEVLKVYNAELKEQAAAKKAAAAAEKTWLAQITRSNQQADKFSVEQEEKAKEAEAKWLTSIQKSNAEADKFFNEIAQKAATEMAKQAEAIWNAAMKESQAESDKFQSELDTNRQIAEQDWLDSVKSSNFAAEQFQQDLDTHAKKIGQTLQLLSSSFRDLGKFGAGAFGSIADGAQVFISLLQQAQKITTTNLTPGQRQLQGLSMVGGGVGGAVGSIQSGNVLGGIESGATTGLGLATMAGAGLAVSAATLGVGAAVIGGIALYRHLAQTKGRDLVTDFSKQFAGGFDEIHKKLDDLDADGGHVGEDLWVKLTQGVGSNNPAQAEAAIADVTKALNDQQTTVDTLTKSFSDLEQQASDFGANIPVDLDELTGQMLAAGKTKEVADSITTLTGALAGYQTQLDKANSWKQVQSDAEAIGISVDNLNGSFHQLQVEGNARDIAKTWDELLPYVGSADNLADHFLDQIEGIVTQSEKMGLKVPDNLEPIIKNLIAQGKLLDDNGVAITDISQIDFEKDPLQESLDNLTQVLKDIRDLFAKDLPAAIDITKRAGIDAANDVGKAWHDNGLDGNGGLNTPPQGNNQPDVGYSEPPPHAAAGFYAGSAGDIRVGEGGEAEAGGPASFFRNIFKDLGVGGSGGGVHVTINAMDAASVRTWMRTTGGPEWLDWARRTGYARTGIAQIAGT